MVATPAIRRLIAVPGGVDSIQTGLYAHHTPTALMGTNTHPPPRGGPWVSIREITISISLMDSEEMGKHIYITKSLLYYEVDTPNILIK